MSERKLKPVSVPFIVEWIKPSIYGDLNGIKSGSYEFPAYGHDYSSLMSFAFTRASKACLKNNVKLINVQMKGDYNPETDEIRLWRGSIVRFPGITRF